MMSQGPFRPYMIPVLPLSVWLSKPWQAGVAMVLPSPRGCACVPEWGPSC